MRCSVAGPQSIKERRKSSTKVTEVQKEGKANQMKVQEGKGRKRGRKHLIRLICTCRSHGFSSAPLSGPQTIVRVWILYDSEEQSDKRNFLLNRIVVLIRMCPRGKHRAARTLAQPCPNHLIHRRVNNHKYLTKTNLRFRSAALVRRKHAVRVRRIILVLLASARPLRRIECCTVTRGEGTSGAPHRAFLLIPTACALICCQRKTISQFFTFAL